MEDKEINNENNIKREVNNDDTIQKEDDVTKKKTENSEENDLSLAKNVSLGKHLLIGNAVKKGISVSVRGRASNGGLNSKQAGSAWKSKDDKTGDDQGEEKEKKIDDESFPDLLESTEKIKAELVKDKDKKKKQIKDLKKGEENMMNNTFESLDKNKLSDGIFDKQKKMGMNMFDGLKKNDNNPKRWNDYQTNDVDKNSNNNVNDNETVTGYILPGFKGKHMVGFKCFLKRGMQNPTPPPPSVVYEEVSYFNNLEKNGMQKKFIKINNQVGQQMNQPMNNMQMNSPMNNNNINNMMNMQMGPPMNMQMNSPQQRNNPGGGINNNETDNFNRSNNNSGKFSNDPQHNNQNRFNNNMFKNNNNFNRNSNFGQNNKGDDNNMGNGKIMNSGSMQGNNLNYMKRNDKKEDRGFKKKDIDAEGNWRNTSISNRNDTNNVNSPNTNNNGNNRMMRNFGNGKNFNMDINFVSIEKDIENNNELILNFNFQSVGNTPGNNKNMFNKNNMGNQMGNNVGGGHDSFNYGSHNFSNNNNINNENINDNPNNNKFDYNKNAFNNLNANNKNMNSLDSRKARMRDVRNMNGKNKVNDG